MRLRHLLIFLLCSAFMQAQTVVDIVVGSENHNTLEAAVIAAGLDDTLAGDGPFTLFAPTDDAFAALPEGTVETLLEDPTGALTDILLYHAVGATALSTDLSDGQVIATINGKDITVTINMDGVFINDAQVTMANLEADNGVVHVIDAVLLPPSNTIVDIVVNSDVHNTLETAVLATGLDTVLSMEGPFTLFAPTDDAFAALPDGTVEALLEDTTGALANILLYHAVGAEALSTDLTDGQVITTVNGKDVTVTINMDGVFINDAQVTMADVEADNGVIHVIDAVLIPPVITVVDIIVNSENHNTLETAVIAAGLDGVLSGDGPFTVFAPTDDAFAALPEGTIETLLEDPTGALTDVLLYHAVAANALSSDLTDGMTIPTINGKNVTVTINMDGVFINDAQVTMADIETDNGVVHVIDAVLLPPDPTVFDIIADSPDHNTLELLLNAAELNVPLSAEGTFTVFAPTDDALSVLDQATVDALLADPMGQLSDILQYHVAGSTILSTDLTDKLIGSSLNGFDFLIRTNGPEPTVNAAVITVTDLEGTNGVVHVIDALLVPITTASVIANSQGFANLTAVLQLTGQLNNLNDPEVKTTLFAPTDAAFVAVPEDILQSLIDAPEKLESTLLYHLLSGRAFADELSDGQMITMFQGEDTEITINSDGVFINGARIILTDFFTVNGVIHVIDAVLLPAPTTVMDVVIRSEDHNVLQIALDTANLSSTLQGDGTFTVFAPTDAAFSGIPVETLNTLLSDPEGDLTDILLYHVLGSEVLSTDLSDGMSATTLNGADIDVTIVDGDVFINGAQVIVADITTDNGIVHVIDMVLLPPVGTTDLPSSEANVYPSPASTLVTVEFNDAQFNQPNIYIIDNAGRAIRNINNVQSGIAVDVSELQNGIYTVVISDQEYSITKRITKVD